MESVLLKANFVNLSTGQYWLKIDEEKGMSDREGHGHKAVLYKSHFPPLRHSFRQRHRCIRRLINHVYYKGQTSLLSFAPTTVTLVASPLGICRGSRRVDELLSASLDAATAVPAVGVENNHAFLRSESAHEDVVVVSLEVWNITADG